MIIKSHNFTKVEETLYLSASKFKASLVLHSIGADEAKEWLWNHNFRIGKILRYSLYESIFEH